MGTAIVLGCGNVGLGAIHGLASEGVQVVAVAVDQRDFAQHSRSAQRGVVAPTVDHPDELLQFLLTNETLPEGALLLPTTDSTALLCSHNHEALSSRFAVAADRDIDRLLNKSQLNSCAAEVGVALPLWFKAESIDDLEAHRAELAFPCLLKPSESHRFQEALGKKLFVIESFDQLRDCFLLARKHGLEVIVTELIPGADADLYFYRVYIDSRGHATGELCAQKVRHHPPHFGGSRVSRTVPMIEPLRQSTRKLLEAIGYRGFASAEYKLDKRDGRFKLMEINVRLITTTRLCTIAGVNFPHLAYLDLVERRSAYPSSYDNDLWWVDLYADLWNLVASRDQEPLSARQYLEPYLHVDTVYCQPLLTDPVPCGIRAWKLARSLFKQVAARGISHTWEVQRCEP